MKTTLDIGDVVRVTSLQHHERLSQSTFRPKDRKQVMVLMLLGYEAKDESELLDLDKAMDDLGWEQKEEQEQPHD